MALAKALLKSGKVMKHVRMFSAVVDAPTDEVLVNKMNNKLVLTLNRPKALNALNLPMIHTLYNALIDVFANKSVDLVILRSNSEKAFCAGGDVVAVCNSAKQNGSVHREFFHHEYIVNHMIGTLPVPFVALIHGITMGGGCGLSINGKFRVATEKTMLAMPETALGLFPDVGGSYFLSRLRDNLGLFLALTGHRLHGADVLHSGLATHYVEAKDLSDLQASLMKLDKPSDNLVDAMMKKFQPQELPPFSLEPYIDVIRECFEGDSYEQIHRNLEMEGSDFAKEQIKVLSKMSPTSLKVTFKQLKDGKRMKFSEVFPMEYRMSQHFCLSHDFHEGVRAILVDKDRNPKWRPSSASEVSDQLVNRYFTRCGHELNLQSNI